MTVKPGLRDLFWMAAGAAVFLGVFLLVAHYRKFQDPAAQLAFKAQRVEVVRRMRLDLALAAEAEKSAVLAITDKDSQAHADRARAATARVEDGRKRLAELQAKGGAKDEQGILTQFSQAFAEFQRVDRDLLDLAVRNTNLKAYGLAFGPAAAAVAEMDASLARVAAAAGEPASADALKVTQLADAARLAGLRLLAMLPPHIAEEGDRRMDEMEAAMAKEDQAASQALEGLAAMPGIKGNADLAAAAARYARFAEFRTQILKLSRENTNVRSLAISLSQKRKITTVCEEALAALEQAIQNEPVEGLRTRAPISPR